MQEKYKTSHPSTQIQTPLIYELFEDTFSKPHMLITKSQDSSKTIAPQNIQSKLIWTVEGNCNIAVWSATVKAYDIIDPSKSIIIANSTQDIILRLPFSEHLQWKLVKHYH